METFNIELVIVKAMQGGWLPSKRGFKPTTKALGDLTYAKALLMLQGIEWILLDPLFWEALGKSLGWKKYTWHTYPGHSKIWNEHQTDDMGDNPYAKSETYAVRYITAVLMQHRFVDHINEGTEIESYFNELLK